MSAYRWANDVRDPSSETVISIIKALKQIDSNAAEAFKSLYLKDI